jgi:hypothetical protein
MKTLDNRMLDTIREMTNEDKMYIILAFNDVLQTFVENFDE